MNKNIFTVNAVGNMSNPLLKEKIIQWINCADLHNLLASFGVKSPASSNKELLEWLLDFTMNWDFRSKQKHSLETKITESCRWLIKKEQVTEEQKNKTISCIQKLGLISIDTPTFNAYDYILVLGGARFSCLQRPLYAYDIIKKNNFAPKATVMLSGMRPVEESEREATNTYAKDATTEFDLINKGAERAFNLSNNFDEKKYIDPVNMHNSWALRTYKTHKFSFPIISISAPSTEPKKRRANSLDTFLYFLKKCHVKANERLLLITSQIYVPYQHLEAMRGIGIPHNVYIDTIGFPSEWNTNIQGLQEAENYLQEIRSTLQAMNRLNIL